MIAAIVCFLLTSITQPLDQTIKIQKLLDTHAGQTVILPKGTIWITTLNVPKKTHVMINEGTIIKGLPTKQALPLINLSTDVLITGLGKLDGNRRNRNTGVGIRAFDSDNIRIADVTISEIAEQGILLAGCAKISIINVKVNSCGAKDVDQFQAINIVTSNYVNITGCSVDGAQHGIQWWGDESKGWCKQIEINKNLVRNVKGGGIWGSKGESVSITNNSVSTCGDVGIDFESSKNSQASNNIVRNCKNYGLAVFFASKNITFFKNKIYQDTNFGHGIGLTGEGKSSAIIFSSNTVSVKGTSRCGLVTDGVDIATNVTIEKSTFTTTGKEGIPIRILDNDNFNVVNNPSIRGAGAVGISLEGSSNSVVSGNKVTHLGKDNNKFGVQGGIFIYYRSTNFPAKNNIVKSNVVSGYKTGINDDCWGDVNSNNLFENNITPNFAHRAANTAWGGKSINNKTVDRKASTTIMIK